MYKVQKVQGGWSVFRVDSPDACPELVPRPTDREQDKHKPYSKRQAAYRRCKMLNDQEKALDEQIARDGAIII